MPRHNWLHLVPNKDNYASVCITGKKWKRCILGCKPLCVRFPGLTAILGVVVKVLLQEIQVPQQAMVSKKGSEYKTLGLIQSAAKPLSRTKPSAKLAYGQPLRQVLACPAWELVPCAMDWLTQSPQSRMPFPHCLLT